MEARSDIGYTLEAARAAGNGWARRKTPPARIVKALRRVMALPPLNIAATVALLAICAAMILVERLGAPVTLALKFKGDLKRESRWFAQYGQAACTLVAALLVLKLHPSGVKAAVPVFLSPVATAIVGAVIKRLFGRVRPGHERAGHFLGPTVRHANFRESFPSNHSASAVALSVALAALLPAAGLIFWGLALMCASIRYLMDAHWPSDILGGIAFGYLMAHATFWVLSTYAHLQ